MTFVQHASAIKPGIGKPMSLQRAHIDSATLTLTFLYREWVHDGYVWNWEPRQQKLALHTHYRIDKRRGVIELLDDAFWTQKGRWATGDRVEPLLYKGQVKHDRGQRIEFVYEHFTPEQVDDPSIINLEEIDTVASARLGYDVLKYSPIPKEKAPTGDPWDWEKKVGSGGI